MKSYTVYTYTVKNEKQTGDIYSSVNVQECCMTHLPLFLLVLKNNISLKNRLIVLRFSEEDKLAIE